MGINQEGNQYIKLSRSLPYYLHSAEGRKLSSSEKDIIREKLQGKDQIILELGSGSGGHIISLAKREPTYFHVGFEYRYKRAYKTAEKASEDSLQNLYVIRADALEASELLSPQSVLGIYINFPDPWERRKWRKHRIINSDSLLSWHHLLCPNGFIRYKTDHEGYYRSSQILFDLSPLYHVDAVSEDLHQSPFVANNIETEFEKLFKYKGLKTYYLDARAVKQSL